MYDSLSVKLVNIYPKDREVIFFSLPTHPFSGRERSNIGLSYRHNLKYI